MHIDIFIYVSFYLKQQNTRIAIIKDFESMEYHSQAFKIKKTNVFMLNSDDIR